jgi:hypothetical protein
MRSGAPPVTKGCLIFVWVAEAQRVPGHETKNHIYLPMHLLIPPMLGTLIWVGGSTVGIVLVILIVVLLLR